NVYDGVMDTNVVLPLGPERCKVIFDFYFARTEGPEARQFMEQSMAVAHQIQLEDWGVCEEVQRGLRCRAYATGRFSVRREAAGEGGQRRRRGRTYATGPVSARREAAGYHFDRVLARGLQNDGTRARGA